MKCALIHTLQQKKENYGPRRSGPEVIKFRMQRYLKSLCKSVKYCYRVYYSKVKKMPYTHLFYEGCSLNISFKIKRTFLFCIIKDQH